MRHTGPKARRVRRLGFNVYGSDKYDKILQRKPNPPGMQAASRGKGKGKMSEYGKQLIEKQKACAMYGLNDRQLRSVYKEASRTVGQTDAMMQGILERRLDNAVFRAGLANTRLQARQFVSHGLFTVNGTRVTIASYRVKSGDEVKVLDRRKTSPVFPGIVSSHEKYVAPSWLQVNSSSLSFQVKEPPAKEEHFDRSIDMRRVIGFYSR